MEELAKLHPAAQIAVPLAMAFAFVGFWYIMYKLNN
jgi:hypothetical protein